MDAVGRNRSRFVLMAKQCLLLPVNEWERKVLDGLIHGNDTMGGPPRRLSTRQVEVSRSFISASSRLFLATWDRTSSANCLVCSSRTLA